MKRLLAGVGMTLAVALLAPTGSSQAEFGCFICEGSDQLEHCAYPRNDYGVTLCETIIGEGLPLMTHCDMGGEICYGIEVGGGGGAGGGCVTAPGGFCPAYCASCVWTH